MMGWPCYFLGMAPAGQGRLRQSILQRAFEGKPVTSQAG
jgi:hypothetical protein